MSTVSNVASTGTTGSTTSSSSAAGSAASQQIAGNFDTFLQLLTTQLQNQDPLSPMDTNSFTQELVEFSSVEQQIDMNTNMQTLISMQQTTEATSAMQLVGSNVTISGNTATLSNATNTPATWSLTTTTPATANVTITSAAGTTAYTGTIALNAGTQTYTWNGQGSNGQTWPDGTYTISVTATGANGQPVTVSTQTQGTVTGVNLSNNPPTLTVNGQSVQIGQITSITNGSQSGLSTLNNTINTLNTNLTSLSNKL
ncbi:MAG: flagellar biosynthesis protein FlgD [Hyphomicrobiales bacterium]|nr:flagellar biosynthesis protein FlgD [Hyphomicrobiales bacterium]MDE1972967.1 flagellar biosynthesis protein FlgD [Hyphomicrobiales bacterium]MDE2285327.1 flagellar biosynthesis protein FlgD [Hyphomicrobiales bacterium]MDE2373182.1 flagellar biosynthesis protein FlgD [Hyphomicrobiales bacterium]